ncbi:YbaB/EbfC family nucleoid-associated protein [Georhizobium profundi]|uniref:Nucleoid-associated protein D5400_01365 n=1 Tax=Georhizobium profundi TaxID=2341112 RepID=A0A3S9AZF2_9HYPH|nr:YbaB/EbfC family nucleoid-associated protein [Georhizobium profundi]AZN70098.1 YbaB/EbfC family nucleoid-associated protein [Georhizobium profundi]
MRDIMGMMGKLKEMQDKMGSLQEEIAALEVEGTAGGGLVTVKLNGKGHMLGMKVDPSLFKGEEIEVLEDLIIAAHNDAKGKAEAELQKRTQELTAGLPIPPGMKLPF